MTSISNAGRRELLAIIDGYDAAGSPNKPGAHSLRVAVTSGQVAVKDLGLREAIMHDPWLVEACLLEMSETNQVVDRGFICFALHVLFGWNTPQRRQRIEALVA